MAMDLPVLDRDKQETMPLLSGKKPGTQSAFPADTMPRVGTAAAQPAQTSQTVRTTASGTTTMPTLARRVADTVSGAVKSAGADFADIGGVLLDTVRHLDTINSQEYRKSVQEAENAAHYREMLSRGTLDDGTVLDAAGKQRLEMLAQRAEQRAGIYREGAEATHAPISRVISGVYGTADELADSAAQDLADAKEGAGAVGSFLVDAGAAGVQLAGDIGLGLLTGGGALPVVAARSFGGSAQEARRSGADLGQQLAYGAGSAALSVATEKISNVAAPFRKAFGAGAADKLAGRLVSRFGESTAVQTMQKLSQTTMGKIAASAIGEGSEEFVEAVFQPVLQRATYDPDARFDQSQALYDFAIGATLGGIGGAVDVGMGRVQGKENAASKTEAAESVNQGTPDPADVDLVARILSGGEETGTLQSKENTTPVSGTAVNENGLTALTDQEKINLSSGKRNKIISTFSDAVSFIRNALANKSNVDRAYLGKVPDDVAQRVYHDTGVNIRGYTAVLHGDSVRHMFKNHGDTAKESARGQIALTPEAAANIPQVLSAPDRVLLSGNTDVRGLPTLLFEKEIGDYYISAQAVADGTHSIQTDTLYIRKKKNPQDTVSNTNNTAGPEHNVRNVPPQGSSIDLTSAEGSLAGPAPAASSETSSPVEGTRPLNSDFTIPQGAESVNEGQAARRGTGALDELGVRIRGDQGDYDASAWIRGREEARRQTERARRQAEKRLNPTKGEKRFAHGIAEGDYTAADIPASMDRAVVAELAEYYAAEESFKGTDSVKRRGQEIRQENEDLARELLGEPEDYRPMPMLVMNERTPERVMRRLFGEERGEAINQAYIYPVQQNEAEKIRFTNRMLDAVRTFQDSAGRETPLTKQERSLVQQVLEDRFVGETVASMETAQGIRNAAENIRMGKDAGDAAREFGLGAKERELAKRLSRWMENQDLLESGQVDSVKIQNAVETYARQYDRFYDAINDFLTAHGYGTIGFIKGYAPHMQTETTQTKLSAALSALGVNPDAMQLPTSISGLTADYKPGKRWNRFFLTRRGSSTDNDVAKGYETYVSHLADVLYHTDDIARLRGLSRYLRKTYGGEEIANAIDHAEGLRTLDSASQLEALRDAGRIEKGSVLTPQDTRAELEQYIDELYDEIGHMTRYGEFVKYIDNYANILAGKQSMADRGLEYTAGRSSLNAGNRLVSAFARAQVAGNVSSALNQSAQLAQLLAEVDGRSVAGAAADLARATGGRLWNIRAAELFDQSDLLTTKKGIEYLTAKDKPLDQYVTTLFKPAETMDSLISALTVQSKYRQLRSQGMEHAVAMEEANRFATSIMASRAKGSKPLAYESKSLLSQMLHMFQVEAVNSWEHISQDLPRQIRKVAAEHGKAAAGRAVATVAVKGLLSAFLLNRITEAAYGGTPAPFDVLGYLTNFFASGEGKSTNAWLADLLNSGWEKLFGEPLFDGGDDEEEEKKPFNWSQASDDLVYNLLNDIPFARNAAGLLGLGDQTMPLANIAEAVQGVGQAAENSGIFSGEMGGALLTLGGSMLPGGRQAQKTVQGVQTILDGGRMYGYGDNQRLQYPVERDPTNIVQAVLFGNSGLSESRDFYASGDTGLSAKQTQLVKDLDASGADRSEVYEAIQGIRAGESEQAKVQALARASLSDREKLRIYTESIAGSGSTRADTMRELVAMGVSWEKIAETFPFGAGAAAQERYADYVGLGFSPETAGGLAGALDALEPEEGKESVSSLQKYRTVVDYGLSEAEQMTVLREMMEDAEYENLADAYRQGVTPEQFVSFREGVSGLSADKGPTGKTISGSLKRKVMQFIDSMELSNAQKTALYYAAGYAQSTLDDAPWYGRPEYDPWNIIPRLDG